MGRWPRYLTLIVGLGMAATQAISRWQSGQAGDPTIMSAAIILTGLGLGLSIDWWRKGGGGGGLP